MRTQKNTTNNRKKFLKTSILILLGIMMVILVARYITEEKFRSYVDTKILKKQVEQNTLSNIEIDYESSPSIFAYDKYVAILTKNTLSIYTSNGEKKASLEINISKPVFNSRGKYLVIAEQDGQNIYLISDTAIVWQTELDGEISRVNVNKHGYVSVILTNTTYKSVVVSYNPNGKELFRTYLSSTYATCVDISSNNKYLAIGEVDYSGTIIKSNVKMISMELAQSDPEKSVINKYESETGQVISNIKYHDKDMAICMFNSHIHKISLDKNECLLDTNENALFLDINLKDSIAIVEKQSSGLFSYEYEMKIKSSTGSSENLYILNSDVPRELIVCGDIIGINLGTEVQIVNSRGMLLKKYQSKQEIKGLVVGESIVGIIYKDKIELVNI